MKIHLLIVFLLILSAVLLQTETTICYQKLAGGICLGWAIGAIIIALGKDGHVKNFQDTDYYKNSKKE